MVYRRSGYRKRRGGYGKRRRVYRESNQKPKQMMGHLVNRSLEYAKGIPGPVGMLARGLGLVKSLINVETKFLDTISSGNPDSSTGVLFCLNLVAEGDDINQRNGRSILNDSLTIHWTMSMNLLSQNTYIKCLVFADKKPDSGTPTLASLLGASPDVNAQINKATEGDRYVMLRHWVETLTRDNMTAKAGKLHINLKGTHTIFDATSGSSATDIEKNAIWIAFLSNEVELFPAVQLRSRFRYKDN